MRHAIDTGIHEGRHSSNRAFFAACRIRLCHNTETGTQGLIEPVLDFELAVGRQGLVNDFRFRGHGIYPTEFPPREHAFISMHQQVAIFRPAASKKPDQMIAGDVV